MRFNLKHSFAIGLYAVCKKVLKGQKFFLKAINIVYNPLAFVIYIVSTTMEHKIRAAESDL